LSHFQPISLTIGANLSAASLAKRKKKKSYYMESDDFCVFLELPRLLVALAVDYAHY
jgi:hypothetical protein